MLRLIFPPVYAVLRKHDPFDLLEAIFFIVYTGCRWSRLPIGYPPCKTVYHHYRSWSARGVERTFSWLQTYRRLMRNYERYLCTAGYLTLLAMIFFMLRYFA